VSQLAEITQFIFGQPLSKTNNALKKSVFRGRLKFSCRHRYRSHFWGNIMQLYRWFAFLAFNILALVPGPASAVDAGNLAGPERTAIETIIHDYLLQHPDVLIDALRIANAKLRADALEKKKTELKRYRKELIDDPATPTTGKPDADITIVEFFDYQCPYCKAMQPIVQELLNKDDKLRIAYKDLPLLGPVSVIAARAALAAARQGKYEQFHRALLGIKGPLAEDAIYKVAETVGIDVDRLKKDMAVPEVNQQLQANALLAVALGIHGTPAWVIGDQLIIGGIDKLRLTELVGDARKQLAVSASDPTR
jgi:protein-disulfide isomerase